MMKRPGREGTEEGQKGETGKEEKKGMSKRDGSPKETQEKGWKERKGKEQSWVGVEGCYAPERERIGTHHRPSRVNTNLHRFHGSGIIVFT